MSNLRMAQINGIDMEVVLVLHNLSMEDLSIEGQYKNG